MKFSTLLTIICCLMLEIGLGYSQSSNVSLNLKNVTIEQVLDEIENKSEYYFLFNQKLINVTRKVDIVVENKSVRDILAELFANEDIEYIIIDRQIILAQKESLKTKTDFQKLTITGKITDAYSGDPLSNVNVLIEGTSLGTISDHAGNFDIKLETPNSMVEFSLLGYCKKKISVSGVSHVNIILEPDVKKLDEVIVIGYGTVNKYDLTGAVSSVKRNTMNTGPVANVNGLMQNTASGIVFLKNDAQPGAAYNVRIRGTSSQLAENQPLYVIDGLPLDYGNVTPEKLKFLGSPNKDPLNSINPNDILSVEILKDASATAIYGSRGANGVIMITTRKGKSGKLTANYSYTTSIQSECREFTMMNAYEYADLFNKYVNYSGQALTPFTPQELTQFKQMGKGTNWQKEVQRPFGVIQDHNLSISGGNNDLNYYVSTGYTDNKGLVKESEMQRYTCKINLDASPTKKFSLGFNTNLSFILDDQIHQEAGDFGAQFNGIFTARQWAPIWPVHNNDGSYFLNPIRPDIPNPVSLLGISDNIKTFRSLGSVWGEYKVLKTLKVKFEMGGDFQTAQRGNYIPTTVVIGAQKNGIAFLANNSRANYLTNLLLNFSPVLPENHSVDGMFGFSYQNFSNYGNSINQSGFPSDAFFYYNLNAGLQNDGRSSYRYSHKLISSFTRINYGFKNKYLFTFTARMDGSSRFGKNNKWGFFPSGAFAWKIHNEEFLRNNPILSELKFRTSVGISGNQEFDNYQSLLLLSAESEGIYIGSTRVIGIKPRRGANPDLKWESTCQVDAGIDFGLLKNRISGSFGVYRKLTYNLLQNFRLNRASGFEFITSNNGSVLNHGFEFELNSLNIKRKLTWETSFNLSYNKNQWKDRGNAEYGTEDEHGPLGGTYGWVVTGMTNGKYTFKDIRSRDANNKLVNIPDGVVDGNDMVLLGYWLPKYNLGLNNNFTFKNFDLSFFVQGMFGLKQTGGIASMFNLNNIIQEQRMNLPVEFYSLIKADGTFDNNNKYMLNDGTNNTNGGTPNSVTVEDASFIRLRNATLGYSLHAPTLKWVQKVRIYFDAQNLLLITGYSGYNPENRSALYPDVRTYSLGIHITF